MMTKPGRGVTAPEQHTLNNKVLGGEDGRGSLNVPVCLAGHETVPAPHHLEQKPPNWLVPAAAGPDRHVLAGRRHDPVIQASEIE